MVKAELLEVQAQLGTLSAAMPVLDGSKGIVGD